MFPHDADLGHRSRASCSSGRLGQLWRNAGADVVEINAWNHPVPPIVDADALVVLGGSMSCQDDAEAPCSRLPASSSPGQ
ncbi:glutamine amidotransferase [Cutibacterium acnes JCM 18918]|nr:glutamine amidotransferase [Cutibacterium acnes JCM 18918]